jgi:hypothetical protein
MNSTNEIQVEKNNFGGSPQSKNSSDNSTTNLNIFDKIKIPRISLNQKNAQEKGENNVEENEAKNKEIGGKQNSKEESKKDNEGKQQKTVVIKEEVKGNIILN